MKLTNCLINVSARILPDLLMCVNGWESEDPFSVNSYESVYPKNDESGNIHESGKISSSVNLVKVGVLYPNTFESGKFCSVNDS